MLSGACCWSPGKQCMLILGSVAQLHVVDLTLLHNGSCDMGLR
jgi:hypothetical protein